MQLIHQKFLHLPRVCFFPLVSHAPLHPRRMADGVFQRIFDNPIVDGGDANQAMSAVGLGEVEATGEAGAVLFALELELEAGELFGGDAGEQFGGDAVDACGLAAPLDLVPGAVQVAEVDLHCDLWDIDVSILAEGRSVFWSASGLCFGMSFWK
jgi:hypothetical protein